MAPRKGLSMNAWIKMIVTGTALCVGGPWLVFYVQPSEEELFKRYSPELQKKALANREKRQQDFDDYVRQLQVHAKSDKNIWVAQRDAEEKKRKEIIEAQFAKKREQEAARQEVRESTYR